MKIRSVIIIILILSVITTVFSSCEQTGSHAFGRDVSKLVMHIVVDNRDTVYESLKNAFDEDVFEAKYNEWSQMLNGVDSIDAKMVSYSTVSEGGVEITECSLGVYTQSGNFIVSAAKRSDVEGYSEFSIVPDDKNILPPYDEDK